MGIKNTKFYIYIDTSGAIGSKRKLSALSSSNNKKPTKRVKKSSPITDEESEPGLIKSCSILC